MQRNRDGTRKSARKRRSSQAWDEYEVDEDYVEALPPKRSRRLVQTTFSDSQEACQKLLTLLMNHELGWPFNQPVDPVALNIPDYFDKILHPMDFGTIQKKLLASEYATPDDFAADVRLVFTNCWTYNLPSSDIHEMATRLSGIFEKQFKTIKNKATSKHAPTNGVRLNGAEHQQMDEIAQMQSVISELKNEHDKLLSELQKLVKGSNQAERSNQVNSVPKKKKAKKEKVKVEVETFTVKQKKELTEKINKLTPEDLQSMVELLSSEIPENQRQNGELEIDLETLSVPTLKKLDHFVDECIKKNGATLGNGAKQDDSSSSSDSDSSSSDSSDSESETEKIDISGGKPNEAST